MRGIEPDASRNGVGDLSGPSYERHAEEDAQKHGEAGDVIGEKAGDDVVEPFAGRNRRHGGFVGHWVHPELDRMG